MRVSTGDAGWGGRFLMVYRNNAGRLGAGFIVVCLQTRWLGHFGDFMSRNFPVNAEAEFQS